MKSSKILKPERLKAPKQRLISMNLKEIDAYDSYLTYYYLRNKKKLSNYQQIIFYKTHCDVMLRRIKLLEDERDEDEI